MPIPDVIFSALRDKIMLFISLKQFVYKYFKLAEEFKSKDNIESAA